MGASPSLFLISDNDVIIAFMIDQGKLYSITLMFWKATIEKLTKLNEIEITSTNPAELDNFETKIADTIEIITIYVDILKPKTFDDKENAISNILIEIIWPLIISFLNKNGRSINLKGLIEHSWDDPEKIERLTELFSIAGETWHVLIVKLPMEFKSLVEILLLLTNYNEDLDIVKYTFKFWYDLKLMLISTPYANAKKLFSPIYSELVEILINHLKYPLSSNSTNLKDRSL